MLFLLKVEIKKLPDIPVKDFLGVVVKEWEYFIRMSKRGRILAGGKMAGSRGAAAIIEVDTNEDLDQLVSCYQQIFTFLNEPRRILFDVISENQRSIIFSHELEVGIKCK